jgi:hypothetical protein
VLNEIIDLLYNDIIFLFVVLSLQILTLQDASNGKCEFMQFGALASFYSVTGVDLLCSAFEISTSTRYALECLCLLPIIYGVYLVIKQADLFGKKQNTSE